MILPVLKRVAADSNVLLSAVIGKAAARVFTRTDLEVITTAFNCDEVREYLPVLSKKYKLDPQDVSLQFEMLPLSVYPPAYYKEWMPHALRTIKDPDDAHLLALSMKQGVPIWSNDEDFNLRMVQRYTTAELLRYFK